MLPLEQVGSLCDIAELYITIKNNKKAVERLERALSISITIDFSGDKIYSLLKIASLYIKIGQNEKANKLLTIAQVGDVIINIAAKQVWSAESFAYALNTAYQKNKTIYIVVRRRHEAKYLKVKLN